MTDLKAVGSHLDRTTHLQIIMGYGPHFPNHAALRLIETDDRTLFWDPGGYYRADDPRADRWHDVMLSDPPDLQAYMNFRLTDCDDTGVEVFCWRLDSDEALRLGRLLRPGPDGLRPATDFDPETGGLFCCWAVSKFLMKFARSWVRIDQCFMLPQSLAERLWHQQPHCVLVYKNKQWRLYRPSSESTSGASSPR